MKTYLDLSLFYALAAMAAGVFYREFTKWHDFVGVTVLGKVHGHLFVLGMLIFLIVALFAQRAELQKAKTHRPFLWIYNSGVCLSAVMMLVRGISQVLGLNLSSAADAAIAGMAGIGHLLTAAGLILLLILLRQCFISRETAGRPTLFHVKKRTLLAVAGFVWLLAGFNVARLGVLSYQKLPAITAVQIILSIVVFCLFGRMFFKISIKHSGRIKDYEEAFRPVWHFFDLRGYILMAIMMGGGIWLRSSGLVPDIFIAVFYTGLGCALALAGVLFWFMFFRYKEKHGE